MRSNRGRMHFTSTLGIELRRPLLKFAQPDNQETNQQAELPVMGRSEPTSVCIIVEHLPVPVDRRVWRATIRHPSFIRPTRNVSQPHSARELLAPVSAAESELSLPT